MFKNPVIFLSIAICLFLSGCLKERRKQTNNDRVQQNIEVLGTSIAGKAEQFCSVYDENLGEFTQEHEMLVRTAQEQVENCVSS